MGSQSIKAITSEAERKKVIYHLLNDVRALKQMIKDDRFEKGIQRVGAEQELCLINKHYRPSLDAMKILEKVNDPHFTTERALFNLEINLDPVILGNDCFSVIKDQLNSLLSKVKKAAHEVGDVRILLAGILPTLKKKDLVFSNMTPFDRYKILNEVLKNIRGDDFKLNIRGVDELILKHKSILFEACNTSFQVHLQIDLDEIVDKYNWSQAIAGPMLSVMSNSPVLMGRELWSETRIALFQQSIDLRNTSYLLREQKPRVSFGNSWFRKSIIELFTDDISRYTPLVTTDFKEDSLELLNSGTIPKLNALNLHNGTLYKWNRVCYGVQDNKPHLRIENRYIPSGPSVEDEIANALLWVGVMQGMPDDYKEIWKKMSFKDARGNFINAARTGIDTYFNWFGEGISAKRLLKKILIPMAKKGLKRSEINKSDIKYYLNIIEQRINKNKNGSKWIVRSKRNLLKTTTRYESCILLTHHMYKNQQLNLPVHKWDLAEVDINKMSNKFDKIYRIMTTELFVVNENDLVELVAKIMEWKNINHLPVVNEVNKITGIITKSNIDALDIKKTKENLVIAKDIMIKKVISVDPETFIEDAKEIMIKNDIGCLPIIDGDELIGIFTKSDLKRLDKSSNANE